jgi:hypothetical protein
MKLLEKLSDSRLLKEEYQIPIVCEGFFIIIDSNSLGPFLPANLYQISIRKCDYYHNVKHTVVV